MLPILLAGIDVGRTFTDLIAIDEPTGRIVVTKSSSAQQREAAVALAAWMR
jgi:N-methylhydantoinase A/oxoprolinase/acetone carboxylase beta subunit